MIQDVGNIELCESLETEPKTQCKACLRYWNIGMVHCTCGHFLHKETEVNRKFVKYTMDVLSVPEYVIKKGRPHGHRCGKKPGDKEYYLANQLKKKCQKRLCQGTHDRFLHCCEPMTRHGALRHRFLMPACRTFGITHQVLVHKSVGRKASMKHERQVLFGERI